MEKLYTIRISTPVLPCIALPGTQQKLAYLARVPLACRAPNAGELCEMHEVPRSRNH